MKEKERLYHVEIVLDGVSNEYVYAYESDVSWFKKELKDDFYKRVEVYCEVTERELFFPDKEIISYLKIKEYKEA